MSMAKGAEEEFVVLSKVRTGLKREFAFALKSQNEVAGSLGGRTRSRRALYGLSGVQEAPSGKRFKQSSSRSRKNSEDDGREGLDLVEDGAIVKFDAGDVGGGAEKGKGEKMVVESEGELKSDVLDAVSDDDNKSHSAESLRAVDSDGLALIASDDGPKSDSDDSKGNAVMPGADVDMEQARGLKRSLKMLQGTPGMNGDNEDIQDIPASADDFVTPDRKGKRFTRSALKSNLEEETSGLHVDGEADVTASSKSVQAVPRKLKDLLDTGLLEGLSVRYCRGAKFKSSKEGGLRGVVSGTGILCFCEECKGAAVVTPTVFELHAGSSNKRPPDYIYMENGNTFRDVLNACKQSKVGDLETIIRNGIGHTRKEKEAALCITCKGPVAERRKARLVCDTCAMLKADEKTPKTVTKLTKGPGRSAEDLGQKSSDNAKKPAPSGTKTHGKLTRKDLRLHRLVFEDGALPDGTEVGYYVRGKKMLSGTKQGAGFLCNCCEKEVSPSQFEAHAGYASRRKPYLHIFTSDGVSLHELSVSLSKKRKFSPEDNDDLCSICCQPGSLLCCDGCPRAFHKECIPMAEVPDGNWYCRYCDNMFQREGYARTNANAMAAGRINGVDPIDQITHRCIRIVKPQEPESGGCALCRKHDFAKGGFHPLMVLLCDQCEREFHVGCLRDYGIQDLQKMPDGLWFCCSGCENINSALQQLMDDGELEIPGDLIDLIKGKHAANGSEDLKLDIKWRLMSGKMSDVANTRALLSKAVSIFHEQFDPIAVPNSSQDIIPHMVYGRNVKDKEFGGMYCAVLSVNSVIVSAGVFRVFGKEIAELPLVATASGFQKLGYFQVLYSCIERTLGDLDVDHLWLPAADEAKPMWTGKFGFSDFPPKEFAKSKKHYPLMMFDGTCMLRKPVPKSRVAPVLLEGAGQTSGSAGISENHAKATEAVPEDGTLQAVTNGDAVLPDDAADSSAHAMEIEADGKPILEDGDEMHAADVSPVATEAGETNEETETHSIRVSQDAGVAQVGEMEVAMEDDGK